MSYPNQLKIKINKPKYDDDYVKENGAFMQIGISEWQEAFRSVGGNPSAMGLYFYLASNADGYEKYLSCADYKKVTNKERASYHRGVALLKKKGYIYKDASGSLNFATTPQKSCEIELQKWEENDAKMEQNSSKSDTTKSQICNASVPNMNIEINSINTNKENKEIDKSASRSSLSCLKEIIAPNGQYIGGDKRGQWLEDEVPNLWGLTRLARIEAIQQHTDFNKDEAQMISYSILDYKNRKFKTIRECDFYEDIFFIGE